MPFKHNASHLHRISPGPPRHNWPAYDLAVNVTTGEIAAHVPTEGHADDAA
jgi:hypothetical protein